MEQFLLFSDILFSKIKWKLLTTSEFKELNVLHVSRLMLRILSRQAFKPEFRVWKEKAHVLNLFLGILIFWFWIFPTTSLGILFSRP